MTTADSGPTRLLLTGASGAMGSMLRPRLAAPGRILRLLDLAPVDDLTLGEESVQASVTDRDALAIACKDVDAVIHLGGQSREAPWSHVLSVNVDGTQAVLDAAQHAGVGKVVLASSNHAAGFWTRADAPLPATAAPRPDSFYGWSKAAAEALGALYHHRFAMDVVCLRIGSATVRPGDARALATWLSPDDAARLVEAAISPAAVGFHIVWGISANTRRWVTLDEGAAIGYHPRDDAEDFAAHLLAATGEPDLTDPYHHRIGGGLCDEPLGEWPSS